jgi:hypothetical protein
LPSQTLNHCLIPLIDLSITPTFGMCTPTLNLPSTSQGDAPPQTTSAPLLNVTSPDIPVRPLFLNIKQLSMTTV